MTDRANIAEVRGVQETLRHILHLMSPQELAKVATVTLEAMERMEREGVIELTE